jgi:hypothetical protein
MASSPSRRDTPTSSSSAARRRPGVEHRLQGEIRHLANHIYRRRPEPREIADRGLRLLVARDVAHGDSDRRLAHELRGHERQRRSGEEREERGETVGQGVHPLPIEAQEIAGAVERMHHQASVHHGADLVKLGTRTP